MHQSDFFGRDARDLLPTLVRAKGDGFVDASGRSFVDAGSGAILTNIGQGNRRVIKAMAAQAKRLTFTYVRNSRHLPNEALAERLRGMNRSGYDAAYLSTDGSDAMEAAIKIARVLAVARGERDRVHVLSLRPSYHGGTLATLPLSGDPGYSDLIPLGSFACSQVDSPFALAQNRVGDQGRSHWEQSLDLLEAEVARLGSYNLLAIVIEPIGGVSNGAYVLPVEYLAGLRALSSRYGIQLIYDEIMAHIRTGWFLTSDRLDPTDRPDMVVIGKGLGAGYTPIAATLMTGDIRKEIAEGPGFQLSHTYNANPISCATAVAVLAEVERLGLMKAAREKGAVISSELRRMQADGLGIREVRGEGLLIGIHLEPTNKAGVSPSERVRQAALNNGLLIYARDTHGGAYGHWVMMAPPLTVSSRGMEEILHRFRRSLEEAAVDPKPPRISAEQVLS